jgi:hypothetical protein
MDDKLENLKRHLEMLHEKMPPTDVRDTTTDAIVDAIDYLYSVVAGLIEESEPPPDD